MKNLLLFACISLSFFSCKKDNPGNFRPSYPDLAGKWKLDTVKEISTNVTTVKPPSVLGDVIIGFSYTSSLAGDFSGNTPTNKLTGTFIANKGINLSITSISDANETSWGTLFLDNVKATIHFRVRDDGRLVFFANPYRPTELIFSRQ